MVIKGSARGGAIDLAKHLLRLDTNERAELMELRGVAAEDLRGALREIETVALGMRSKRPFYHASINTDPGEEMTPEQWTRAIDALEKQMGLEGQPRAVVEHVKAGRQHRHVVWSRVDLEHMRAVPDSFNYYDHEAVARMLEQEFGHKRVQGAHVGREGAERPDRTPSHAEMQQAERTGLSAREAKEQITAIWQRTDSGQAFAAALADEGWILARGDKRDFVAVDRDGEVHSLARRIEGAKAKDVRERMSDIDAANLPSVTDARAQQLALQQERGSPAEPEIPAPAQAPAREPEAEPPATSGRELHELGEVAERGALKGLQVADRLTGAVAKLTEFVADLLTGFFVPPPRKISAAEMAINAEARREYYRQQAAERDRVAALDHIREDIYAGRNLDAASVRQLNHGDWQNIKDKGDPHLRELIEQREQDAKRQRDYGGRERER